jgi:hypothetical protein
LLKSHFDAIEQSLLALSRIPANSGHTNHKGTPRENFVSQFLQSHLSEKVAVGSGEIIDANSKPGEKRNQHDIIIYKREYPKIDFGASISGFLAESVVATIEVKSILDNIAMKQAINSAINTKALDRNLICVMKSNVYHPCSILNYLVAYDGPAKMSTACDWMLNEHALRGITPPIFGQDIIARESQASPSLDGVFLLGRGYFHFENTPIGFGVESRSTRPTDHWEIVNTEKGSVLLLFLLLTMAISGFSFSMFNPISYLSSYRINRNSITYK